MHKPILKPSAYGQTDRGKMRRENDDSLLVEGAEGLFAVADGLGGLPEGGLASTIAIEQIKKLILGTPADAVPDFAGAFGVANRAVHLEGTRVNADLGIGTTLTAARLRGNLLDIGHVGDSGLVVFYENRWRQITQDHTMAQDMIDRLGPGEHAFIPEYFQHTLTRCIGQGQSVQTDLYTHPLTGFERVLLYTDGVTKVLTMKELHEMAWASATPEAFVKAIIKLANDRGGPDNCTAVAIFMDA